MHPVSSCSECFFPPGYEPTSLVSTVMGGLAGAGAGTATGCMVTKNVALEILSMGVGGLSGAVSAISVVAIYAACRQNGMNDTHTDVYQPAIRSRTIRGLSYRIRTNASVVTDQPTRTPREAGPINTTTMLQFTHPFLPPYTPYPPEAPPLYSSGASGPNPSEAPPLYSPETSGPNSPEAPLHFSETPEPNPSEAPPPYSPTA